jgi:hypothetical protein
LPWVATVRERGVVAGNDNPCGLLVNYRLTLSTPVPRVRLPSIPIFFAPNKQAKECQDR